jgi:hypothetical protein
MLKSVVVYVCEIWPMTEKDQTMLTMWQMKILVKMYEPIIEQGIWKIITMK